MIDLDAAPGIRASVIQDLVPQPIGETRGETLRARILPRGPHAADKRRLRAGFAKLLEQRVAASRKSRNFASKPTAAEVCEPSPEVRVYLIADA